MIPSAKRKKKKKKRRSKCLLTFFYDAMGEFIPCCAYVEKCVVVFRGIVITEILIPDQGERETGTGADAGGTDVRAQKKEISFGHQDEMVQRPEC